MQDAHGQAAPLERKGPIVKVVGVDAKQGSAAAVVVGDTPLLHTGQVFPGSVKDPATLPPAAQVDAVLANLDRLLKAEGADLSAVVKLNVVLTEENLRPVVAAGLGRAFASRRPPAVSYVVSRLPAPGLLAVDAVAVGGEAGAVGASVRRSRAEWPFLLGGTAPAAVLPDGPKVYVSGQADRGVNLTEATRQTLVGLSKTLAHFDMDPTLVVQVKAFVTPMADAGVVVKEVERWFGSPVAPPLVLVEWESASLPIEIELIAAAGRPKIDEQRPVVDYMATPELAHTAVFSRVARINGPQLVYIGGLYGAATPSDSDGEVRSLFAQLNDVLNQTGSDRRHLVKATYYTVGDGVVGAL
ncbi:MAG: RidA family protein, partial [Planctomycetia bacterium]